MRQFKKIFVLFLVLLFLAGCAGIGVDPPSGPAGRAALDQTSPAVRLEVHFLDVGQGDSILVRFPDGRNMLVDAGTNDSAAVVGGYLKKNGVKKLDYLVGTHPHEDHIGSLDAVINGFQIGELMMPKATTNTRTFRDVLAAVEKKGLRITTARAGVDVAEGADWQVKILAPNGDGYESLNNYSAVIKVRYKDVSFLLTGDAEELSEKEMLAAGADVGARVLKVGHHGSHSSTSPAFLKAVNPRYAVISVGAGNDYHHPHREVLNRLKKAGVEVLRTDQRGTVVFSTDGGEITVTTEK